MGSDASGDGGLLAAAGASASEARRSLGSVFRNRNLRRVNLALAASMIGDWAYATAVTVWAYDVGGAAAVGIWGAVRLTLMAVGAPVGSILADRFPRRTVMIATDLVRALTVVAAAACLIVDAPDAMIFVLGTLAALFGAPFRPAQMALMPALADNPEELTASNGASSTIESLAFFVGPALGASLLAVADIEVVFLFNAATFLVSAMLVVGLRPRQQPVPDVEEVLVGPSGTTDGVAPDGPPAADAPPPEHRSSFLRESLAGFRAIASDRDLTMITVLVCAQTVVAGASLVYVLVMVVDLLDQPASRVGFLDSVLGVGAIIGGFVAIARAPRHRLAGDLGVGVVLWAIPLVLVALWPSLVTVLVAMVLTGLANPVVDVSYATILQRITPDAVLGRVFGALEGALIATMALGAFVMPFAIEWFGLRWSITALGVGVTLVVLPYVPRLRRLDRAFAPPAGLALLRGVDIFAPLTPPVLETLARSLERVVVPAGAEILREGGESDRFFVVETGAVEVTRAGSPIRREGAGEYFGEIGLLRDVPRTATITALEETVLLAMDRDDFLRAVTGNQEARMAADDVVSRRLTV